MAEQGEFMKKEVYCPVCVFKIPVLKPKVGTSKPVKRDTDFHVIYTGVNPLFYEIVVCPKCFYSAYEPEVRKIKQDDTKLIKGIKSPVPDAAKAMKFTEERNAAVAIASFHLAIRSYSALPKQDETLGGLYLRTAWLYRESQKEAEEKAMMQKSAEFYEKSFSSQRVFKSPQGEAGLLYLVGELHRRVGNIPLAIQWFSRCIQNPVTKARPELENLARDQWMEAKKLVPAS